MKHAILFVALVLCLGHIALAATVAGQATLSEKSGAGEAVVYLEGSRKADPLMNAMVDQRNKMFIPHVSVVTVGTTVRFPNDDTVFHNVFAYFQAKRFDLGMYPRGASKKVTFDKPGLVALFCNIHSNMSAYILVVDTPYYAICDKEGRFRIRDVPAGHYTLHAWHESGAVLTRDVDIAAGDDTIDVPLERK